MSLTRLEIDVKRLLLVCEEMAQNNSSDDWRLSKVYIIKQFFLNFNLHHNTLFYNLLEKKLFYIQSFE